MTYYCCDQNRRAAVMEHGTLNGIDHLEVVDTAAPAGSPRQRTLLVRCLKPLPELTVLNLSIEGGERISPVQVAWAFPAPEVPDDLVNDDEQTLLSSLDTPGQVLVVRTETAGDFSTYRLRLVTSPTNATPPTT